MIEHNPIYDRIARERKAPFKRVAPVIALVSGIGGLSIALLFLGLADSHQNQDFMLGTQVMSGFALVVTIVLPLLGLILATIATAHFYYSQEFALLRITTVTPQAIHAGLVKGNAFRLRIMRYIGLALIPSGLIGVAFDIGIVIALIDCFRPFCPTYFSAYTRVGVVPAAMIVVSLVLVHFFLWRLCLNVGVWLSLRAGRLATAYASGLIIGISAIALLLILGTLRVASENMLFGIIVAVPLGVGAPVITWLLSYELGRWIEYDSIEEIRSHPNPPVT